MFTSSPPINPSFNFNSFFKSVSQSGNNSMNTSSPSGGSPSNNSQISPIEGNNNSSNNQNHLQSPQDQSNNTNQFMAALASLSNISNQQQQQQQMKDMSNPFMSGLNNLGMNINPMMMSNPAFFTHLLQNSMGNPMAMNFFQQMFLNNNNNGNNDNKSSSPFNQMNNLKRSYDSISKSPSSPLQSAELLNYMKDISFKNSNGMLQCILCNSEYRNIKDMCEHILEERSKMTNLYKHLGRPIEIISGSNGGPSSINAPIDLQLEGRFKRFETSIDSIKQNQKNRYQQKVMLSAHPIVTRSPSTTVSSPFRDGRTSVEGGCSDSASRCSTSTGGGNGSSKGNINNDEGKKFCIFDNCCKKCHKVVEYLCINMKLKQPLCKDCLDVSTHQKNNISNIENIPFNHDNNIKNKDKTSEENILPEDILIKVEGSEE